MLFTHDYLCFSVKNTGTAEIDKLYELSSKCKDLQRNFRSYSFDHKVSCNTQIGQCFYSKSCLLLILSYFFHNMWKKHDVILQVDLLRKGFSFQTSSWGWTLDFSAGHRTHCWLLLWLLIFQEIFDGPIRWLKGIKGELEDNSGSDKWRKSAMKTEGGRGNVSSEAPVMWLTWEQQCS